MTRAWFVSDIHLRSMNERSSEKLLRFLHSVKEQSEKAIRDGKHDKLFVFLVGDIFDLWIGSHTYFVERFRPLVDVLGELAKMGVEVHYFEGNHDLYLREFWENRLGVKVHPDSAYFDICGKVVRVEHGDLINPDDHGYLFLRSLLRSGPVSFLARHLPAKLVSLIGERASAASRKYTSTAKELPVAKIRELVRTHAERAFKEKPFDLIVSGHVHVEDDHSFQVDGRAVRSVNLGSWFETSRVFNLTESAEDTGFSDV